MGLRAPNADSQTFPAERTHLRVRYTGEPFVVVEAGPRSWVNLEGVPRHGTVPRPSRVALALDALLVRDPARVAFTRKTCEHGAFVFRSLA